MWYTLDNKASNANGKQGFGADYGTQPSDGFSFRLKPLILQLLEVVLELFSIIPNAITIVKSPPILKYCRFSAQKPLVVHKYSRRFLMQNCLHCQLRACIYFCFEAISTILIQSKPEFPITKWSIHFGKLSGGAHFIFSSFLLPIKWTNSPFPYVYVRKFRRNSSSFGCGRRNVYRLEFSGPIQTRLKLGRISLKFSEFWKLRIWKFSVRYEIRMLPKL